MDLLTLVCLLIVLYHLFYFVYPFFSDCDARLAYQERFGKPIDTLKGKVVWITGASSGIGEQLAYVLAEAGCKLILTSRREAELQKVKANCLNANKELKESDVEVYAFDICNLDLHEKSFKDILDKFGRLDILVNNAGRSQRAEWEEIDLNVDRAMFELNVFSLISLSRLVGKYFLKTGQGHFVVTSSFAGISPVPNSATYCATKHALHGYFNTLLLEKPECPIKVTMACPGPIQTNFLAECFTEKIDKKYGKNTEVSQSKVSASRCARLMGVAIANEMEEVWIAKPTCLLIFYLVQYYPNVGARVVRWLGVKFLQRLRDAKVPQKTE